MPCLSDHVEGKDTHFKHFFSTTFHLKHITEIARFLDAVAADGDKGSEGCCCQSKGLSHPSQCVESLDTIWSGDVTVVIVLSDAGAGALRRH